MNPLSKLWEAVKNSRMNGEQLDSKTKHENDREVEGWDLIRQEIDPLSMELKIRYVWEHKSTGSVLDEKYVFFKNGERNLIELKKIMKDDLNKKLRDDLGL